MGCVGSFSIIELQGTVKNSVGGDNKVAPQNYRLKQAQVPVERRIKICTVNLGKSVSPFQYFISTYDEDNKISFINQEQQQLNNVFKRVYRLYRQSKLNQGEQSKKRIKLNSQFHYRTLKRYTPLKNSKAGIMHKKHKQNKLKVLMTKQQFCQKWTQEFTKVEQQRQIWSWLKQFEDFRQKQQLKKSLRQFDLICYHAIVAYVYEVKGLLSKQAIIQYLPSSTDPIAHLNRIVSSNLPIRYEAEMESRFGNPIFNMKQKISRLFNFVDKQQFDIIFLQEVPKRELQFIKSKLKSYRLVSSKSNSSAVLLGQQLSLELEKKQKNLTLHGHNARYLQSDALNQIKKNQEKNKSVDAFKFTNDNTNLFKKMEIIFSQNYKKNEQDRKFKPSKQISEQEEINKQKSSVIDQQSYEKASSVIYKDLMRQPSFIQQLANETMKKLFKEQQQQPTEADKKQTMGHHISRKLTGSAHHSNLLNNSKLKKTFSSTFGPSIIEEEEEVFTSQFVKATNSIILAGTGKIKDHKIKDFNKSIQSVCQFIGCLILTSVKVTSREQIQNLKIHIQNLSKRYPHHTIIVGLSSHMSSKNTQRSTIKDQMKIFRNQQQEDLKIHFTPNIYNAIPGFFQDQRCSISSRKLKNLVEKKGLYTSYNKKTCFNLNDEEHDAEYLGTDNFIISNKKIMQEQIKACNNQTINENSTFCKHKRSTPNIDHPFSDFFVCGQIYTDIRQVLQKNQNILEEDEDQLYQENYQKNLT